MRRAPRSLLVIALTVVLAGLLAPATAVPTLPKLPKPQAPGLRAGVGISDLTWRVGAGAGQYGTDGGAPATLAEGGGIDPHAQSVKKVPAYGVQSRLSARAIVVEGTNGERVALIKTDNYLAQDLLQRRVGQLLEGGASGVTRDRILLGATHTHSSPYTSTPSAGVWVFQDAAELRAFEYQARSIADAITKAADDLRPATMGATTVRTKVVKDNIVGPARADDGTPAGYPRDFGDDGLVVLRFDDVSDAKRPKPLATWMNYGQHPESLDGYDLTSADYIAPLERFVAQDTGAPVVFSQGDVGSAEGPYFRDGYQTLPDGTVRAWAHVGYAQTERGARLLADAVVEGWKLIGAGGGQVPASRNVPVGMYDAWVPGPVSHPYPGINGCRTESTIEGNPGVGTAAECTRPAEQDPAAAALLETAKAQGIPVPENYDMPALGVVEENARIRLQAVRLGEVLLASCACEAQADLILNLESRTDKTAGNLWDGYDWSLQCTDRKDGTWQCPTGVVSDALVKRMQAQVHNDAKGWDDPAYAPYANAEPVDPAQIKGNFTKEELPPALGFTLPVGIGHAGDYNGYTVSYREYQSRDSYRKALTSYGPHTADYMNTRLVRMAGALKGGPRLTDELTSPIALADEARQEALARAVGVAAAAALDGYEAGLPDDPGAAEVLRQPASISRFAATTLRWRGGTNAIDNPRVRVERLQKGKRGVDEWVPFAGQAGEVQTFFDFGTADGVVDSVVGAHATGRESIWTANFEAFDAAPPALPNVPDGQYRFVVDGRRRQGGATVPYSLTSAPFTVSPWTGIAVGDLRREGNGGASFTIDTTYPRTYTPDPVIRFIADDGNPVLCKTCTFRPWAKKGTVASATVTVVGADGKAVRSVAATPAGGRWVAPTALVPGESVRIDAGAVVDTFGERNGTPVALG